MDRVRSDLASVRGELERSLAEAAYLAVGIGLLGLRQLRTSLEAGKRLVGEHRPTS